VGRHPDDGVKAALRSAPWAVLGWKVMTELPNPVNFEAAAAPVTEDDIRAMFANGAEPQTYVNAVRAYADAGFDHVALMNAGPDPDGFIDFYAEQLRDQLSAL